MSTKITDYDCRGSVWGLPRGGARHIMGQAQRERRAEKLPEQEGLKERVTMAEPAEVEGSHLPCDRFCGNRRRRRRHWREG